MTTLRPYSEYKPSGIDWLGVIPAHWECRSLKGSGVRTFGGATPKSDVGEYWNGDVVWATPEDVSRSTKIFGSRRTLTQQGLSSCAARIAPAGSVVLTCRAPIGNIAIAAVPLATNQGCKTLVLDPRWFGTEYLFRVLTAAKQKLQSLGDGSTFAEISTNGVSAFVIPVPPLDEQRAIADFLDAIDARVTRFIAARRRMIALLEEQKAAIINQAVTRGLDPDAPLKPSGIDWLGDIPAHWDVRRLKSHYREIDERSETGDEEQLSVSHLTGVTKRSDKTITMFQADTYEGHKLCQPGDLVVNTMWAWMGALGVSRLSGLVSPSYAVYRPRRSDGVMPEFINLLLRTRGYVDEYNRRSTGIHSSRLRLYPDQFLNIAVAVPPINEQRELFGASQAIDQQAKQSAAKYSREIELVQEYRTRLFSDVVTGKLDVRGVDLPAVEEVVDASIESITSEWQPVGEVVE